MCFPAEKEDPVKPSSLVRLTAFENYTGQVLWISLGTGVLTLLLMATVSDASLSHQLRVVDVASYFLIDLVVLVTAIFMGASLYSRDFSNRGIAELAIPSGMSRQSLLTWRLLSHGICLGGLVLFMYLVRWFAFIFADVSSSSFLADSAIMWLFTTLKSILALTVATFFGCHTRPVVALLGTTAFFGFGHFASGVSGLQDISEQASHLTSDTVRFFFRLLRIWNPNYLTFESLQGQWESIGAMELLGRAGWGLGACLVFLALAMLSVLKRDIGAFRL